MTNVLTKAVCELNVRQFLDLNNAFLKSKQGLTELAQRQIEITLCVLHSKSTFNQFLPRFNSLKTFDDIELIPEDCGVSIMLKRRGMEMQSFPFLLDDFTEQEFEEFVKKQLEDEIKRKEEIAAQIHKLSTEIQELQTNMSQSQLII